MKLSEMMILGAMMSPQTRGQLANDKGTCGLGAVVEASGLLDKWKAIAALPQSEQLGKWDDFWSSVPFYRFMQSIYIHPITGERRTVNSIIISLNDSHKWTRERIAQWIATIEPQEVTDIVIPSITEAECVTR